MKRSAFFAAWYVLLAGAAAFGQAENPPVVTTPVVPAFGAPGFGFPGFGGMPCARRPHRRAWREARPI